MYEKAENQWGEMEANYRYYGSIEEMDFYKAFESYIMLHTDRLWE